MHSKFNTYCKAIEKLGGEQWSLFDLDMELDGQRFITRGYNLDGLVNVRQHGKDVYIYKDKVKYTLEEFKQWYLKNSL